MIKIDNWAFIRTEIYHAKEEKCYKARVCSLAKDFNYKLNRVTGIINSGEIFYLGTINPYYSAFKNAVDMELPIMSEVSLTRGLDGNYQLKGLLSNNQTELKKIVGQDVEKNLLYFADKSYAFIDWVNAQFDDKVKVDLIRKRLDFKEYVGLNIMPIFKF